MYSVSPNLIKHYVPLSFSKQSLDFERVPHQAVTVPLDQNPLMNIKLKKINERVKDFVLIFKNKSCKEFSPKKKIRYSPVLRDMKNIPKTDRNDERQNDEQNLENVFEEFDKKYCTNFELIRPRKITTSYQIQRRDISPRKKRQIKTPASMRQLINNYSSAKEPPSTAASAKNSNSLWRSGRIISGSQKRKTMKSVKKVGQQSEANFQTCLKFKVCGKKAPKSETVDHLKKLMIDPHFSLLRSLMK